MVNEVHMSNEKTDNMVPRQVSMPAERLPILKTMDKLKPAKLALLLSMVAICACGQRAVIGAYEGELLSSRNVLVIDSQQDSIVQGQVFTSHFESVPFVGLYSKHRLRGTIMRSAESGDMVVFLGLVKRDTIHVTLFSSVDSTDIRTSRLSKVSGRANYDVERTFGPPKVELDERLVGRWDFLFSEKASGEKIDTRISTFAIEYFSNGTFDVFSPLLDEIRTSRNAGQQITITKKWFTSNGKIISTTVMHIPASVTAKMAAHGMPLPPETSQSVDLYEIRGDTLVTTTSAKTRSYYIRK